MKKTLIALAAVAATTGAMAQATITGFYSAEYAKTDGSDAALSFNDSLVTLSFADDLGAGLKMSVVANVNAFGGRDVTPAGEDAFATLSGGFGAVKIGRVESANGIIGRGLGGAPVMGADGAGVAAVPAADAYVGISDDGEDPVVVPATEAVAGTYVLAPASNVWTIAYTSPDVNGFKFGVSATEAAGNMADAAITVSASYDNGPLSIGADYRDNDERVRVSSSYDLGVAKIGAGYEVDGAAGENYVMGFSVPMGALTVGAAFSKNQDNGNKATEVGASYALSKRTTLSAAYRDLSLGNDKIRVRLGTSF